MRHEEITAISLDPISPSLQARLLSDGSQTSPRECPERPSKRRKLAAKAEERESNERIRWDDHITLARTRMSLGFDTPSSDRTSTNLHPRDEPLSVNIKTLDEVRAGEYHLELQNEGKHLANLRVQAVITRETLKFLQQAIELQHVNKNSYAKTLCFIDCCSHNSTAQILVLDVRIIWRNARSLAESRNNKQNDLLTYLTSDSNHKVSDAWSPSDFYESVHVPERDNNKADKLEVPGLECQLYPFQKRAIHWLLCRENVDEHGNPIADSIPSFRELAHGFFMSTDADGRTIYINQWLGIATTDPNIFDNHATRVSGGILAEEMGLGKTVEVISLLLLHKRRMTEQTKIKKEGSLRSSGSTLIVAPASILQQWQSEIHMHAPSLKAMIYEGIKTVTKTSKEEDMVEELLKYDVILATYHTLAKEIHFSGNAPQRSLRHEPQYKRKLSPLVQIHWWRCVLDECQMVESGVSHAAQVANQIPRHHAWAISGTPLQKDASDLFGLLTFLRLEPYSHSLPLWNRLVEKHKTTFKELFGVIALRHTKDLVRKDIQLPPQKRVVITVPFTQIEEQYYSNMFREMCDSCGFDFDGSPLSDDSSPDDPSLVERMRSWLSRLRQLCLHPEVGDRNRRALGHAEGTLRTVGEVLQVMMDQNETATRTEERSYFLSRLRRGQILEFAKQTEDALEIWLGILNQSQKVVEECRNELEKAHKREAAVSPEEDDTGMDARLGVFRLRLRSALEVEHVSTFFVATAYYQIKSNEAITEPDSDRFKELEKMETETYERAKTLRTEMLRETQSRADGLMAGIRDQAKDQKFVVIPNCKSLDFSGGIESRNVLHKLDDLSQALNAQAEMLDDIREEMVELLLLPLVDQEEEELQGNEYETSTKQQDDVYAYMAVVRAMVADRRDALTGQENTLIKSETATSLQLAIKGEGHAPELMKSLLLQRQNLKPLPQMGSIRGILSELRALKTTLRAKEENGSTRASAELTIINGALQKIQSDSTKHTKVVVELESEVNLYRDAMNARLDYYRQLQTISDAVAPYEEEANNSKLAEMERNEAKMRNKIATLKSRGRYLIHLQEDSSVEDIQRKCIICQEEFEIGTLTSCGHAFCKECLNLWWKQHSTCPVCKKYLKMSDFHQITYKPQELTMHEEEGNFQSSGTSCSSSTASDPSTPSSIYSTINTTTLSQIKNIDVSGSFGTKIDTLARHILWLRTNDPGAKSIVFSQFRDFLDVLARAFQKFEIRYTAIDRRDGIERFKHDPAVECFFLHAKAHASGLNLVNATHVFLCEPLINTALELQAIARVHRIGQHAPTTVWMYLVEDTVEKAIYDISVKRRLEHIGASSSAGERSRKKRHDGRSEDIEESIEVANSHELQEAPLARLLAGGKGGGEMVGKDDLWNCLFGHGGKSKKAGGMVGDEVEVPLRGILAADAAERRAEVGR